MYCVIFYCFFLIFIIFPHQLLSPSLMLYIGQLWLVTFEGEEEEKEMTKIFRKCNLNALCA